MFLVTKKKLLMKKAHKAYIYVWTDFKINKIMLWISLFGIYLDISTIKGSCITINWMMIFGFCGIDSDPSEMIILMGFVSLGQLY